MTFSPIIYLYSLLSLRVLATIVALSIRTKQVSHHSSVPSVGFRENAILLLALIPLLYNPNASGPSSEVWVLKLSVALAIVGQSLAVLGILELGSSSGLRPAKRDTVTTGIYSHIRHPIYLGYFLSESGFVLSHPDLNNSIVLLFSAGTLFGRALLENRLHWSQKRHAT